MIKRLILLIAIIALIASPVMASGVYCEPPQSGKVYSYQTLDCTPDDLAPNWGWYYSSQNVTNDLTTPYSIYSDNVRRQIPVPSSPAKKYLLVCSPNIGGGYCWNNLYWWEIGNYTPTMAIGFTGTPLAGPPTLAVNFTDTSTGPGIISYNWSSPNSSVFFDTPTARNTSAQFPVSGNYTITHGITNSSYSLSLTKSDYVWVYNSTVLVTTGFRAKDANTGYVIKDAAISILDVENNSWKNTTGSYGVSSITLLSGHHANAYATASGYSDADYLNQLASFYTYDIPMLPTGFANVSSGNITAYITVKDYDTLQTLEGVLVTSQYPGTNGVISNTQNTNGAGMASFVLPNKTTVHFGAVKSGYGGQSIVLYTGTGSGGDSHITGNISISKNTVTGTPTITTLPGGGTPVPTVTYLKNCDPSASDYDAAKCRESHGNSGLNLLAANLDNIVMLCLFVTVMYLLGIRLGR
jgi:hypothetical protein